MVEDWVEEEKEMAMVVEDDACVAYESVVDGDDGGDGDGGDEWCVRSKCRHKYCYCNQYRIPSNYWAKSTLSF